MAIIVAVLALFVGFCALWLASFALRKIDSQISEFLRGPIAQLRESLGEVKAMAASTQAEQERFQRQCKDALTNLHRELETLRAADAQSTKAIAELAETVRILANAQQGRPPQQAVRRQAGE